MFAKIPKVKTENVRVWHRKSLLMEKALTEKIGVLVVPQIYLAHWTMPRDLGNWGNRYTEVLVGAWPFMIKGINISFSWTMGPWKAFSCSSSGSALVPWFCGGGREVVGNEVRL